MRRECGLCPCSLTGAHRRREPPKVVMVAPSGGGRTFGGRAGRRGSSEDDLPLRLNHAQDLGVGRGLNPAPDEHGPADTEYDAFPAACECPGLSFLTI